MSDAASHEDGRIMSQNDVIMADTAPKQEGLSQGFQNETNNANINATEGSNQQQMESHASDAQNPSHTTATPDKMALLLQKQLKKRKFQMMTNDAFEENTGSRQFRGRGGHRGGHFHSGPPHKKRNTGKKHKFIVPELSEDVMQKYAEKRRGNFPTRDKMRAEVQERWTRVERGEVIWEDYSRSQWQLNKDEDSMDPAALHHAEALRKEEERVNSLLDTIVESDKDREINVVLQALRYFVHNRFFLERDELNPDIARQLDDLHERTQREMIHVKESLKKKYPREEDKVESDDDEEENDDDGAADLKAHALSDEDEEEEEDIEDKAINLSDAELERLAAEESEQKDGGAQKTEGNSRGGRGGSNRGNCRGRGDFQHRGRGGGRGTFRGGNRGGSNRGGSRGGGRGSHRGR